jgi:CheY-like chemotaxis protein
MEQPHFLLVEDNPDDIALLYMALDNLGSPLEVSICHDGVEAMDALTACLARRPVEVPRFVLLDINMPKVNGFEVLRRIRAQPALKELPVVMFSSSAQASDVERAFQDHASAYVVKPIDFNDYRRVFASIVARWGAPGEERVDPLDESLRRRYFLGPQSQAGH